MRSPLPFPCVPDRPSKILLVQVGTCPPPIPRLGCLFSFFLSFFWARDWRALALTQVHHWSRLSDSREDGEALSSVHSTALAAGKLIHNLLRDGRVKND